MSQKLENILNLALETPESVRELTDSLNIGFDSETKRWELIVKYNGALDGLSALGITTEPLIAGYAILTVPETLVEEIAAFPQIEYVEKPKRFYYSEGNSPRAPSFPTAAENSLQEPPKIRRAISTSSRADTENPLQETPKTRRAISTSSRADAENPLQEPPKIRRAISTSSRADADDNCGRGGFGKELRACLNTDLGAASCILPVTLREPYLSGRGVLIAVLDSGIDYRLPDFRNEDGSSRILYLWDQTLEPSGGNGLLSALRPPKGFSLGVEFTNLQINEALSLPSRLDSLNLVPSIDSSGHGTAVAGIAASGTEGVAPESSLLIVKLGLPREDGFPRTTEIMRGVTYAVRKALELNMPLVVNLSFGNSYGAHDGSSLLERFLDNASEIGRTTICVGSGNEGNSSGHAQGNVSRRRDVELAVAGYERSLSIQLWKHYADIYRISLRSPGGITRQLPDTISPEKFTLRMEETELLIYLGEPTPYSADQEIYFELIPAAGTYINSGVWQIHIEPVKTVTGQYYLYLPGSAARSIGTGFYNPTPEVSLTIPSTAAKVITVGAYDSAYDSYADFSGRGYADPDRTIGIAGAGLTKPDLAAPGVNVLAPDLNGGYQPVTGTSFATPIVSGCAALLMEWGILQAHDPFLYGEKIKAFLRSGARPIRGESIYPNDKVGFGALCLGDSLPR